MTDPTKSGDKSGPNKMNFDDESAPTKKWPREEDFLEDEEATEQADNDNEVESLESPSIGGLEDKLTEMEQKVHEHWNEMMRARAEMENIRQRADRDINNARKFALEKFAIELLPVVDSIEYGLQHKVEEDGITSKVYEGMELTLEMMLNILEKFGIKQINPKGETFNPAHHEAVSTQPAKGVASNTVVEVMQKGYMLHDRLIRPAMVVVAK